MPVSAGQFFVRGAERTCNWLLVRRAPAARRRVVFFPGDLSDFCAGRGPMPQYSLEALLWVMCVKFPEDMVILVKPRMMVGHFAAYLNFMLVDSTGNPRPLSDSRPSSAGAGAEPDGGEGAGAAGAEADDGGACAPKAVEHLQALLANLDVELGETSEPTPIVLVGFSKGAAVLGALLREAPTEAPFWSRVEAVHYVDAGLTVPGVFPVPDDALQALRRAVPSDFTMWLHGTPRQWEDPGRPFVAEETEAFAARCRAAGLRLERRLYGAGRAASLEQHFDSLRCFATGGARDAEDAGEEHLGFFADWAQVAGECEQ